MSLVSYYETLEEKSFDKHFLSVFYQVKSVGECMVWDNMQEAKCYIKQTHYMNTSFWDRRIGKKP